MPKVGEKEFAYTPKGVAEANKKSAETGIPVSNAINRGESYQLGGLVPGMTGFGQRPGVNPQAQGIGQNPMVDPLARFDKGGKVEEYKKGGQTKKKKAGVQQPKYKPYEKPALSAEQEKKKRHKGKTKEEIALAKKIGTTPTPYIPSSGRE